MKPETQNNTTKVIAEDKGTGNTDDDVNMTEIEEEQLQDLFAWIDEIPLSRPKKNITRDFADGVMVAEIVKHYVPKIVELHNYTPANSLQQKMSNWGTLNRKVLSKLTYNVPENIVRQISSCKPGVVEVVLYQLRKKIDMYLIKITQGGSVGGVPVTSRTKPPPPPPQQISPDGYFNGQEVGSFRQPGNETNRSEKQKGVRQPKHPASMPQKAHANPPYAVTDKDGGYLQGPVPRTRSLPHVNDPQISPEVRLLIEEKEQALLASQETVQILQAKVRRLEHLLHLKDIRIDDLSKKLQQTSHHGYAS
ncbi:sperm flagellar protein 1-like [Glandiceps talaboti]